MADHLQVELVLPFAAPGDTERSNKGLLDGARLATAIRRSQATLNGDPYVPLIIQNGATASSVMDARGFSMFALLLPTAFTGVALTFNVSTDGVNFTQLYDSANNPVTISTVAAGRAYPLPDELAAWPFWQIVSGTTETARRILQIVAKG